MASLLVAGLILIAGGLGALTVLLTAGATLTPHRALVATHDAARHTARHRTPEEWGDE